MTPEAQRIAIAEACGWKWFNGNNQFWITPDGNCDGKQPLPDYLNDLNAMHEAESRILITEKQKADYARELIYIAWTSEQPVYAPIHANADQRREALLRTLGKWVE
jgi:hypothetical protein